MLDVYLRNGRSFLATNLFVPAHPAGPGVVFSHGWGGAHLFDDLHQYLSDTGIFVAFMDQRGYGSSPGTPSLASPTRTRSCRSWAAAAGKSWLS